MTHYNQEEIKSRLPHRDENLLIDNCTCFDNQSCKFDLKIEPEDPLNRTLFLKESNNENYIPIPVLAEIAALASIASATSIKSGTVPYFASISQFSATNSSFKESDLLTGNSEKVSDKKGFVKYKFEINSSSNGFATGLIMAFYSENPTDEEPELPLNPDNPLPSNTSQQTIEPFQSKRNKMTFIDTIYEINEPNQYLFSYQYPLDHPLTKGHFPGNPVMMGVCQWLMIEDAIAYLYKQNKQTNETLSINATIYKKNQTDVCEIKNLTLHINSDTNNINSYQLKRIMFKQKVLPSDFLYLKIDILN